MKRRAGSLGLILLSVALHDGRGEPAQGLHRRTTLVLGPGEAAMTHQTDEYCNIERIRQSAEIYEAIIEDWSKH